MCFILFEVRSRYARCAAIGLRPAARSPDFEKIKHIHWPKGLSLLLAPFFNNPKIVSSRVAIMIYAIGYKQLM